MSHQSLVQFENEQMNAPPCELTIIDVMELAALRALVAQQLQTPKRPPDGKSANEKEKNMKKMSKVDKRERVAPDTMAKRRKEKR